MDSPHESVKELAEDVWKNNKPLVIAAAVALMAVIFVLYKKNQATAIAPTTPAPTVGTPFGNSYTTITKIVQGQPVQVPVPISTPGQPGRIPVDPPIIPPPRVPVPKPPVNKPVPQRIFIVQHWPAQGSTLWGIAQIEYGNGAQWPKIYNANKQAIGNNPNLIKAGTKLIIP